MTLVYARYDHFDEKRAMATTLERELRRILSIGVRRVKIKVFSVSNLNEFTADKEPTRHSGTDQKVVCDGARGVFQSGSL